MKLKEVETFHILTCSVCGKEYDLGDYDYLPYENYDSDMSLITCPDCNYQ